tara:strand:+ start:1556 stop:2995 length:1440 start_codon:yes stop_codon:yes gene_type:complete
MNSSLLQIVYAILLTHSLSAACTQAYLSEVHANPQVKLDIEAEFFEIYAYKLKPPCIIEIHINSQLSIRDTLYISGHHVYSPYSTHPGHQPHKPLTNSSELLFQVFHYGLLESIEDSIIVQPIEIDSILVPSALTGQSWERIVDSAFNTTHLWAKHSTQDSLESSFNYGSPISQKHLNDCLIIGDLDSIQVNCTKDQAVGFVLSKSLGDFKWEDIPDTVWFQTEKRLLVLKLPELFQKSKVSSFYSINNFEIKIVGDDYPINNTSYFISTPYPFEITELQIYSNDSIPEWIKIIRTENTLLKGLNIIVNKKPFVLDTNQHPSEYSSCIYTSDSLKFLAYYGHLRSCLKELSPWPSLINSGGEICLQYQAIPISQNCITWRNQQEHWPTPYQIKSISLASPLFIEGEYFAINLIGFKSTDLIDWAIYNSDGYRYHKESSQAKLLNKNINKQGEKLHQGMYLLFIQIEDKTSSFLFYKNKI